MSRIHLLGRMISDQTCWKPYINRPGWSVVLQFSDNFGFKSRLPERWLQSLPGAKSIPTRATNADWMMYTDCKHQVVLASNARSPTNTNSPTILPGRSSHWKSRIRRMDRLRRPSIHQPGTLNSMGLTQDCRHRHGGANVFAYVLDGEVLSAMNDEEPKVYKPGESW